MPSHPELASATFVAADIAAFIALRVRVVQPTCDARCDGPARHGDRRDPARPRGGHGRRLPTA